MKNFLIICVASQAWDTPLKTNRHYMMHLLSNDNTILFVESLGLRAPTATAHDILRIFAKIKRGLRGKRPTLTRNLYALDPLILPVGLTAKNSLLAKFNSALFELQLRWAIHSIAGALPRILWTYVPSAISLVGKLNETLVVYDCVDEYSSVPGFAQHIYDQDQMLTQRADVVFALSKPIYNEKLRLNPNSFYAPGAADPDFWGLAMDPALAIPEDIANIPKPIIGYVGNLAEHKQDYALLEYLVTTNPDWSIVLIGPQWSGAREVHNALERLTQHKNVYLLGMKEHQLLPGYLKAFDVCIIPQKQNEYARSSFPMKLFEYLGSGRPVVATWTEALAEFNDVIYLARTYEEFRDGINTYLYSDTPADRERRIEFAKQNGWERRLNVLQTAVMDAYKRKVNLNGESTSRC